MEDTFIFYPTFIQQIEAVQSNEVKARLYSAVAQYGCYGIEPDFSDIDPLGILDGLFVAIRYAVDESKSRRRAISDARRAAGMRGGAPKGNTNAQNKQKQANTNKTSVNVNDNVNDNVNVKEDKEKRSARFSAPSLDEVKKFFLENNFTSNPDAFFDYYEANGWTQGNRKPLKKWEAAARQWERRQQEFTPKRSGAKQPPTPQPKPTTTAPADEPIDFGGVRY